MAVVEGGISCAAGGISDANAFARSFAGLSSGELRCVTIGFTNSGLPVLATLGVHRALDGGAPTNLGDDLELLSSRTLLLPPSGPTEVVANLDAPICVDGSTAPIVIVLEVEASATGFVSFAGNGAGESAPTYLKSAGCGIDVFTPPSAIGFADSHWAVIVNGDFAHCHSGEPCPADLDRDTVVGPTDLGIPLGAWAPC